LNASVFVDVATAVRECPVPALSSVVRMEQANGVGMMQVEVPHGQT
jgi:hypothetical protein